MKSLVSIIFITISFMTYAQINNISDDRTNYNEKSGSLWIKFAEDKAVSAQSLITDKKRLQIPQESDLHFKSQKTDNLNITHYKYVQHHAGISVEGGELIIHEKAGKAVSVTGKLSKGLTTEKQIRISEEQALQTATGSFGTARFVWNVPVSELPPKIAAKRIVPKGELVWLSAEILDLERSCLAYKFDIFSLQPLKKEWVYVNAETGTIELTISQIRTHNCFAEATCDHTENNNIRTKFHNSGNTAIAQSNYAGAVQVDTDFDGSIYTLKTQIGDTKIQTFNAGNQGNLFLNPVTSYDNTWTDPTAIDVQWGLERTYTYYKDVHNRNSYDDNGADIFAWVHYDSDYANAFWLDSLLAFGDGNSNYSSMTSLDIVAHEFTHAVTDYSSKLAYSGESGALNESFSDIFGEIIEHYYHPDGNDWIVGSDVVHAPGKKGIRNFANSKDLQMIRLQPDTYQGENWYDDNSADGMHINSGVQNHWFYLLVEGGKGINDKNFAYNIEEGIDIEDAARIVYKSFDYLTSSAGYEDAKMASITAAEDLFGAASTQVKRTAEAWCAVGVGNCTSDISCAVRDSLVLINFYSGWNPNTPMDTWAGVGLNESGCVDSINLQGVVGGPGEIPVSLALLSELKYLNIGHGGFSGYIPSELSQLSQLEVLNLSENYLEGTLPSEFVGLTKLKTLVCNDNLLSGQLPSEYAQLTNLETLHLNDNEFSGILPAEWRGMSNLRTLNVGNNNISGKIPDEYTDLTHLEHLYLAHNQFEGPLPNLSNSPDLQTISIENNNFNFEGLENYLYLNPDFHYNPQAAISLHHDGNEIFADAGGNVADNTYQWFKEDSLLATITGDNTIMIYAPGTYTCIVSNIGLTNPASDETDLVLESTELYADPRPCALRDSLILVDLYHSTNGNNWNSPHWDLTQPVSTWSGVFINANGCVVKLKLNQKGLSGTLPKSIYNLSEVKRLLFYGNPQLNGTIPPEIGNLTNMNLYSIADCNFTDTIPDEIGQLTKLRSFFIGKNNFEGEFPAGLLQLTNLEVLHLPQNNFTGELPIGFDNLTKLRYLNIRNNQFTGTIPQELASLETLSKFYAYSNDFTSPLPTFSYIDVLDIRLNAFNFDDIMNNQHLPDTDFYYKKQSQLPIHSTGNALYVNAGGDIANNTYVWYKDSDSYPVDTIVGNKEYTPPAVEGRYYCKVSSTVFTNETNEKQNLVLTSDIYDSYIDGSEPVYPGDMDNNGIVNNYDALYWGLSNGYTGYTRPDATPQWAAQASSAWLASVDSINAKHQDADGNGTIDEDDFEVIKNNYGKTHGTINTPQGENTDNNLHAKLISKERDGNFTTLTVKISLENDEMMPVSTHGIALNLDYESKAPIDTILRADLDFSDSWLTDGNAGNIKTITQIDNNRISLGITRNDWQNVVGLGEVMTTSIVICEDIPSGEPTESSINISSGGTISANQEILIPLTGDTLDIVHEAEANTCVQNDDESLLILPFDGNSSGVSGEVSIEEDVTYSTGVFGQAAHISPLNKGLTFSTIKNLNLTKGTLEVWVRPYWNGSDGQSHTILQAGTGGGILMQKDGGNYLRLILNRWATQGQPEVSLSYNIEHWNIGKWQHIAYTWGNGQVLMYVNGTIVASDTYTNLPPIDVSEFNIGKDYFNGSTWDGLLDELRISSVIRNPQEIADAVAACTPDRQVTCIDNDDNSLLLLAFENSPDGLSGETPMQTDITYNNIGAFGRAANIPTGSKGLTFNTTDNLDTSEGTLEVWVKPSWNGNDGQSHTIFQAGTSGGILMEKDGGNYLKIILNRWASGGQPEVGIGYKVTHWQAGEWQHIAYTWGNGEILMYINGAIVASKSYTNLPSLDVSEFNIGRDQDGNKTWDGLMDELRISNVIRTPQEIMDAVEMCTPPAQLLTCIDNDDSSLLILSFEDSANGLSGEIPVQSDLTYSTGTYGQAANISIDSSGLTFDAANNLNTSEGTLEVWVKPLWNGNDGQAHTILQAGTWGGMLMQKDGNNHLRLILNRWQGSQEVSLDYKIDHWQAEQWQHIAYTWGNGQAIMYINGNAVDAISYSTLPHLNISEFNIGRDYDAEDTWNGLMDELRISNILRSQQDIINTISNCSPLLKNDIENDINILNYPNPFSNYTTIEFELLKDSPVTLYVFDATGRRVATLLNEQKTSGTHKVIFNANDLTAGVYYYTIQAGEYFGRKNMIIIR